MLYSETRHFPAIQQAVCHSPILGCNLTVSQFVMATGTWSMAPSKYWRGIWIKEIDSTTEKYALPPSSSAYQCICNDSTGSCPEQGSKWRLPTRVLCMSHTHMRCTALSHLQPQSLYPTLMVHQAHQQQLPVSHHNSPGRGEQVALLQPLHLVLLAVWTQAHLQLLLQELLSPSHLVLIRLLQLEDPAQRAVLKPFRKQVRIMELAEQLINWQVRWSYRTRHGVIWLILRFPLVACLTNLAVAAFFLLSSLLL